MNHAALARTLGILSLVLCIGSMLVGLFRDNRLLIVGPLSGLIVAGVGLRLNVRDARDLSQGDEELVLVQSRLPMIGLLCNGLALLGWGIILVILLLNGWK